MCEVCEVWKGWEVIGGYDGGMEGERVGGGGGEGVMRVWRGGEEEGW